jgi:hypothetical protein
MPIPKGKKVRKDGELVSEVAPPGWGHTKAEKEKTKPDKPKSKIGGTIAAMKRAQDRGDIDKNLNIFALAYSMKNKGANPHYKPGTNKKYKKYQEEIIHEKSDAQKRAENEKRNTERSLRMKHGKSWKQFTKDAMAAKDRLKKRGDVRTQEKPLKPGEVRKPRPKWLGGGYTSNKR